MENSIQTLLAEAQEKLCRTARQIGSALPDLAGDDGIYNDESGNISCWTNGFWPGILWMLYDLTGDSCYRTWANECEDKLDLALERMQVDHDVGFVWGLSSVKNVQLTGYAGARLRALKTAHLLASRFNLNGRFLRAWNGKGKEGWAIIDCMMNLPLLYWAAGEMGDPRMRHIAMVHSETVMRHFIRPDGSSCHIVMFDPETGACLGPRDGQGYAPDSAWGRGNAWALHGFALGYQFTREPAFLETARRVGTFFLEHLPEDGVPRADFKAPAEEKNKMDATAGAIAASGFALLHRLTGETQYQDAAVRLLEALRAHCFASPQAQPLLVHGNTAYHTKPPYDDCSIIYGDYYYLEALLRLTGQDAACWKGEGGNA